MKLKRRVKNRRKAADPGGELYVLRIDAPAAEADRLTAVLFEAGAQGIEERSDESGRPHWLVYGDTRAEAERLARVVSRLVRPQGGDRKRDRAMAVRLRVEQHRLAGWRTQWMEGLTRRKLAPGLIVDPSAGEKPRMSRDRVLRLRPALAFGYGEHPTTRLAVAAVARHCRRNVGCSVLDVGTGSGILALSARWCGAKRAVGVDDDPGAVAAARTNARLNGLTGCRFSTQGIERLRGQFDLVVANIDAGFLLARAPQMIRLTAPRGTLAVTGFLEEDAKSLAAAYLALGFERSRMSVEEGWALLVLRLARPQAGARSSPTGATFSQRRRRAR